MLIPQNTKYHHYCSSCFISGSINWIKPDSEILECVTQRSMKNKNNFYWYHCYEIKHYRPHLQESWDNIQRLLFNPER